MTKSCRYLKGKDAACEAAGRGGPGYGNLATGSAMCECRRKDVRDGGAHEDVGTRSGNKKADRGRQDGAGVLMACGASGFEIGGRAWCCNGKRRAAAPMLKPREADTAFFVVF